MDDATHDPGSTRPVPGPGVPRTVTRYRSTRVETVEDVLVDEAPMEIRLGGVPIAVIMRTPGDDRDLALGFALTEGIVFDPGEVSAVEPVDAAAGDRWEIRLAAGVTVDPEQFRRNLYTTSSCGVCGKASIDAVRIAAGTPPPGPVVAPATLLGLPAVLRGNQDGFAATGGIHAAALFTPGGDLLGIREDAGRHNAVDKVVGAAARTSWPPGEVILLVSGRVSFEITQKAAVAGIPFVAGVSAATSLAADLAAELGITVVGFLRDGGFNVYAGAERIAG
jgi:FdhD protein